MQAVSFGASGELVGLGTAFDTTARSPYWWLDTTVLLTVVSVSLSGSVTGSVSATAGFVSFGTSSSNGRTIQEVNVKIIIK